MMMQDGLPVTVAVKAATEKGTARGRGAVGIEIEIGIEIERGGMIMIERGRGEEGTTTMIERGKGEVEGIARGAGAGARVMVGEVRQEMMSAKTRRHLMCLAIWQSLKTSMVT